MTDLLQNGHNACGAILGDGWYCEHVEWRARQRYGDRPKLRAQLQITFQDGSTQSIETDESWKTSSGPILESDMLMGEHYDSRREMSGWNTPYFDDANWRDALVFYVPSLEICAPLGQPVRAQETLPAVAMNVVDAWPGKNIIFDFEQNMVGFVLLQLKAAAGTTIRLRFAEMLQLDGQIYVENLRSARDRLLHFQKRRHRRMAAALHLSRFSLRRNFGLE